jgi:hypothetical protein
VKEVRATAFAPLVRCLDRWLPVPLLLGVVYPVAGMRALVHRLWKGACRPVQRPAWLPASHPFNPRFLDRLPVYLNRIIEFLPDRLHQPKWQRRCRIVGLEYLTVDPSAVRGAILAFVHFGPYPLLRGWLRAAGIPLSMLVRGEATDRSQSNRRKDRWARFPEIQAAYHQDEIPSAIDHLKSGWPLAVAIDVSKGRQMQVTSEAGWTVPLATGAVRLARRHRLQLIACAIYDEGPWRFAIELSPPVSAEVWARGDEAVGAELISNLLPVLRRHPQQYEPGGLIDQFQTAPNLTRQLQEA